MPKTTSCEACASRGACLFELRRPDAGAQLGEALWAQRVLAARECVIALSARKGVTGTNAARRHGGRFGRVGRFAVRHLRCTFIVYTLSHHTITKFRFFTLMHGVRPTGGGRLGRKVRGVLQVLELVHALVRVRVHERGDGGDARVEAGQQPADSALRQPLRCEVIKTSKVSVPEGKKWRVVSIELARALDSGAATTHQPAQRCFGSWKNLDWPITASCTATHRSSCLPYSFPVYVLRTCQPHANSVVSTRPFCSQTDPC